MQISDLRLLDSEVIVDAETGYAINVPLGYQGYPGWQTENPEIIARIYSLRTANGIIVVNDFFVAPTSGARYSNYSDDYMKKPGREELREEIRARMAASRANASKAGTKSANANLIEVIEETIDGLKRMAGIETKKDEVRNVATPEGSRRYGLPIGAVIVNRGDVDDFLPNVRFMKDEPPYKIYTGADRENYRVWKDKSDGLWYVVDNDYGLLFDENGSGGGFSTEADALFKLNDFTNQSDDPERGKREPPVNKKYKDVPQKFRRVTGDERLNPKLRENNDERIPLIPQAWVDVFINEDPDAELIVIGYDYQDRPQSLYSSAHTLKAAAAKQDRNIELLKYLPKLDAGISADWPTSDSAKALLLIRVTGMRPGSTSDTKARVQAYGATTLLAKHITINQNSVTIDFIGKGGKSIRLNITDPETIEMLTMAKGSKKGNTRIFPDVTEASVRSAMHRHAPKDFMIKDLRTVRANELALRELKKIKTPPTTLKEFMKMRLEIAKVVSAQLGNTPAMALKSYINPTVFSTISTDPSWSADLVAKILGAATDSGDDVDE